MRSFAAAVAVPRRLRPSRRAGADGRVRRARTKRQWLRSRSGSQRIRTCIPKEQERAKTALNLFRYRRPFSLEHFTLALKRVSNEHANMGTADDDEGTEATSSSSVGGGGGGGAGGGGGGGNPFPLLEHFLENEKVLRALRFMPAAFTWIRLLLQRYNRRIDRETARRTTVGDVLAQAPPHERGHAVGDGLRVLLARAQPRDEHVGPYARVAAVELAQRAHVLDRLERAQERARVDAQRLERVALGERLGEEAMGLGGRGTSGRLRRASPVSLGKQASRGQRGLRQARRGLRPQHCTPLLPPKALQRVL